MIDYETIVDLVWSIIDKKNQGIYRISVISLILFTFYIGAMLVFMPGLAEILTLVDMLENNTRNRNKQCCVYPLHSSLPPHQQEAIFARPPPGTFNYNYYNFYTLGVNLTYSLGKTKIIVSTNIAETSVTIDDVTVVIDRYILFLRVIILSSLIFKYVSGLANQSQYEYGNSTNRLVMSYVSKAALRQRMGRAGRTSPGICYRYNININHIESVN